MATQDSILENFFALSLDLLCIADLDGYFHKLSDSWGILGYPITDLIGKRFLDYVHPDDIVATELAMNRLKDNETIEKFRNRYRCKDGSYRIIEWRSCRYDNLTFAVARDVTSLDQTEQALKESESRYRSVVSSMSEGVVVHAHDGSIQTCNRAAERILGLTQDQMKGLTSIDPRWRAIHEDGSPFPGETHP
ncbi:MAG: PAS domain S-box protein, partial [Anaerolineae bacterium]|nr:PAS domain S-box protein [Anaerolineae bacterium]